MSGRILYKHPVNSFVRTLLKPLSPWLPTGVKFPVTGIFTVRGKGVKPFKMKTNPTSAVTKFLFWDDVEGFEYSSVRVFLDLAKSSKVFFDIGANIGYYSLLASSINNKIVVHAFEPMPSIYDFLLDNVRLNGFNNIIPRQLALSDQPGTATFYGIQNKKFPGMPQLTGDGSLNSSHSNSSNKVSFLVNIQTLDNYVSENLKGEKLDLIKLDTEAHEHFVLRGAHEVLSQHRPLIQCEILKNQIEKELEEIIAPYNYRYYRATPEGLQPVSSFLGNDSKYVDYYLVPSEKQALVEKFVIG
jgi:FkbM family methyltransferase